MDSCHAAQWGAVCSSRAIDSELPFRARRELLESICFFLALKRACQGQNLALTILSVPNSIDSSSSYAAGRFGVCLGKAIDFDILCDMGMVEPRIAQAELRTKHGTLQNCTFVCFDSSAICLSGQSYGH